MFWIILLGAAVLVALFYHTLVDLVNSHCRGHPPGPLSLPIIGGLLYVSPRQLCQSLVKLSRKYGAVFSLRLGNQGRVVFLNSLSSIQSVLQERSAGNRPNNPILHFLSDQGYGIMVAPYGKVWQAQHRMAHSAIAQCISGSAETKINRVLQLLCDDFKAKEGLIFDPSEELRLTSSNILLAVLIGHECDTLNNTDIQEQLKNHNAVMENISPTGLLTIFPFLLNFPNMWRNTLTDAMKARDKILYSRYEASLAKLQDQGNIRDMPVWKTSESECVFDILVRVSEKYRLDENTNWIPHPDMSHNSQKNDDNELCNPFSRRHLVASMWGFMLAGTDTTSSVMQWMVLYLANFPEVEHRAATEVLAVIGQKTPSFSDKHHLPYTEALLRECLRMSSVAGLSPPHTSDQDIVIDGFNIPKGMQMFPNLWAIHHDEKAWPQPEKLKPERFLDEDGKILPVWHFPHYLPFSQGTRPCVGSTLSRSLLFLFLVTFLQNFRVKLVTTPDLNGEMRFGLVPKPYKIQIFAKSRP